MTLSVGLGKIQNDPDASVLTRKALGALSNPALIVYDDALTIDDTGRLVLKLKEGGGLSQDEDGLSTVSSSFPWTRWITATGSVSVIYNAESSDHDIAVAGAVTGDLVIVSPTNMSLAASLTVYGWSGRVRASGIVTIRISKLNNPLVSNETIAFRVLVIGVT